MLRLRHFLLLSIAPLLGCEGDQAGRPQPAVSKVCDGGQDSAMAELADGCDDATPADSGAVVRDAASMRPRLLYRYELTLLGPIETLTRIVATPLTVKTPPAEGADEPATVYLGEWDDWNQRILLADPLRESEIALRPWICPQMSGAAEAARAGHVVTESRLVEVDAAGQFWTNGRLGAPFTSRCSWATSPSSLSVTDSILDGPCLCAEPERSRTYVEVLDATGRVVSTPEVCYATFGAVADGLVEVGLSRSVDTSTDKAFTLQASHCVAKDASLPAEVTPTSLQNPSCNLEKIVLGLGVRGEDGSGPLGVTDGHWTIRAASPDRRGSHVSDIDLTFAPYAGTAYRVRGRIELPQILF